MFNKAYVSEAVVNTDVALEFLHKICVPAGRLTSPNTEILKRAIDNLRQASAELEDLYNRLNK